MNALIEKRQKSIIDLFISKNNSFFSEANTFIEICLKTIDNKENDCFTLINFYINDEKLKDDLHQKIRKVSSNIKHKSFSSKDYVSDFLDAEASVVIKLLDDFLTYINDNYNLKFSYKKFKYLIDEEMSKRNGIDGSNKSIIKVEKIITNKVINNPQQDESIIELMVLNDKDDKLLHDSLYGTHQKDYNLVKTILKYKLNQVGTYGKLSVRNILVLKNLYRLIHLDFLKDYNLENFLTIEEIINIAKYNLEKYEDPGLVIKYFNRFLDEKIVKNVYKCNINQEYYEDLIHKIYNCRNNNYDEVMSFFAKISFNRLKHNGSIPYIYELIIKNIKSKNEKLYYSKMVLHLNKSMYVSRMDILDFFTKFHNEISLQNLSYLCQKDELYLETALLEIIDLYLSKNEYLYAIMTVDWIVDEIKKRKYSKKELLILKKEIFKKIFIGSGSLEIDKKYIYELERNNLLLSKEEFFEVFKEDFKELTKKGPICTKLYRGKLFYYYQHLIENKKLDSEELEMLFVFSIEYLWQRLYDYFIANFDKSFLDREIFANRKYVVKCHLHSAYFGSRLFLKQLEKTYDMTPKNSKFFWISSDIEEIRIKDSIKKYNINIDFDEYHF